jgi:SAM-dependent methyltransferase
MGLLLDRARAYPLKFRYDADLAGERQLAELGHAADGRERYVASRLLPTVRAIRRLGLRAGDVVADLGAGKGLGVLVAAEYPVERVVGVEIVPELAEVARANVARNALRLQAREVEVVTADILDWRVPDDLTVAYLYSPFFGAVFAQVLDGLLESLDRRPRPFRLVYTFPREHARLLGTGRVKLLDVTSALWPTRRGWWRRPHVIATYGFDDGPFDRPHGLPASRRALAAWSGPAPAVDWSE